MALTSKPTGRPQVYPIPSIKELLTLIEAKTGKKLPQRIASIALAGNTLHIRFRKPRTREADVEPLPLTTPTFLFHDEETGEPTSLEILDIDTLLQELQQHSTTRHPKEKPTQQ